MGEGVKEIPLGVYLASKLEFQTSINDQLEGEGKVVTFSHEKLERGNWKLDWAMGEVKPKTKRGNKATK